MPSDFLDQLADFDVPPPPVAFNHDLHEKLNRSLMSLHVIDLLMRALPIAALEFARAVVGFLCLTLTGDYPKKGDRDR
jgi:hypothetical protein